MKFAIQRMRYLSRLAIGNSSYTMMNLTLLDQCISDYPLKGSIEGATVVDVGSDCGTSIVYWRAHGAAKVIGYEINKNYVAMLRTLRRRKWFEFRGAWNGEMPAGDIFKIDCEGCEKKLDVKKLRNYALWFVALHDHSRLNPTVTTMNMAPELEAIGGKPVHPQTFVHAQPREVVYTGGNSL